MRRTSLRLGILLALLAALVAAPLPAGAAADASGHGRPWPTHRITYVDRTLDHRAVRIAVRAWNHSGLDIRFVKAARGQRPDVVIRNSAHVPGGCGTGLAQLGYVPGHQSFIDILHGTDADGQNCAWPGQALVMTHELGHVLGLGHIENACSIMNDHHVNGVAPFRCLDPNHADAPRPGRWWCRLLAAPELKMAQRWYGGHPHVASPEWCDVVPRIAATGALSVFPPSSGDAGFTLTRAPEPPLPGWLGTWGYGMPGSEVHVTPDACTAVPGDRSTMVAALAWGSTGVGGRASGSLGRLAPGTYCVAAWQFDQISVYAQAPATAMLTVT